MNDESSAPRIAGDAIGHACHACAFFEGPEEEYRVLLPFAKDCADCGIRCLHFVDPASRAQRESKLRSAGVDVSPSASRMDVRTWDDTYLRGGSFDPDYMLSLIAELLRAGKTTELARIWANMGWALHADPGSSKLIEYEMRLNPLVEAAGAVVICTYPIGLFSPGVVLKVLRAHPFIVVNGRFEQNPLYGGAGG